MNPSVNNPLGPRDTVVGRKRCISKKTDYRHRYKMLKNYEKIYRLTFLKKNNYCVAGLYQTYDPAQSDKCLFCFDSRFFNLKTNLKDNYAFGLLVAEKINYLKNKSKLFDVNKFIVLDLKKHKNIIYSEFVRALKEKLDPGISYTF